MHVPAEIQSRVAAEVLKCTALAEKHFNRSYPSIRIVYNLRGTTAGRANGTDLIRLNAILLMENIEDYINNTVPHEVAHCIDTANGDNARQGINVLFTRMGRMRRVKRSIHGPTWQRIMRLFGADAARLHDYDVSNAQVKVKRKYEYRCPSCTRSIFLGPVRHRRMVNGGGTYWCRRCGSVHGKLVFVQAVGQRTWAELYDKHKKPAPTPTPAPIVTPVLRAHGAMDTARAILASAAYNLTRKQFIERAIAAGIKATTASTYYNMLKR